MKASGKKHTGMTKKVNITIPDGVFDMLNDEAEKQGRTPANLAAFIVEHHLIFYRYLLYRLMYADQGHTENSPSINLPINVESLIEKALSGQRLEDCELGILAENLNLDQKRLTHFRDQNTKIRSKSGEYNTTQTT